jgi:hypothetical protein
VLCVSKTRKDDSFNIAIGMELPVDVSHAEISLIEAHLRELIQQIIREADQED